MNSIELSKYNNKFIKMKLNKYEKVIFLIIFLIIAFSHFFVGLYHDDFGYASLSYGYTLDGVDGINFKASDLFNYLLWHYNSWGGRILCFFVEIILLRLGIRVYMFMQSIVITLILYYIYKIVKYFNNGKSNSIIIILLLGLYMLFPINVVNNGFYWTSASILYVWPLLPCIMGIYYFIIINDELTIGGITNDKYIKILPFIFFLATFSQEQIGFATIVFIVAYIILYQNKNIKKYIKLDILVIIPSIVGYSLLMLAPGNFSRMKIQSVDNLSLINIVLDRINLIKYIIFNKNNTIYLVILFICFIYIMISLFLNTGKLGKMKVLFLIPIIISSIFSQIMMVVSPSIPERIQIVMWFLLFIFIAIIFNNISNKKIVSLLVITIFLFGIVNYGKITLGYFQNYAVLKENDRLLNELSQNYTNSSVKTITLTKLYNPIYGGSMPYDKGTEYITDWIKQYYNLPNSIEMKWVSGLNLDFTPEISSIYPDKIKVVDNNDIAIGVSAEKFDENTIIVVEGEELITTYSLDFISAMVPYRLLENKDVIKVSLKWELYDVVSQEISVPIIK